jgi:hypothetical protein
VEAWRNPGYRCNKRVALKELKNRSNEIGAAHYSGDDDTARRRRFSSAPSEQSSFNITTQGSAKPPPWAKLFYAFGVTGAIDVPGADGQHVICYLLFAMRFARLFGAMERREAQARL